MKYLMIFHRDLRLALKQGWAAPLGFFLIMILSFPLGLTASQDLTAFACGLIWIGLLLAHLLIVPRLLEADLADGVMDFLLVETKLPAAVMIAKSLAAWVGASLPLVALVPLAGILLGLPPSALGSLVSSALIGSLALVFLSSFAAALTGGLRTAFWLMPLLLLPLELPVLIFGAAAARLPFNIFFTAPPSLILMGLVLMTVALAPLAAAFALTSQEN